MKTNFTATLNSLIATTQDQLSEKSFFNPSFEIYDKFLHIFDFGIKKNSYTFDQFGTIDGVAPSDLNDALEKLLLLVANFSGGGATPQNIDEVLTVGSVTEQTLSIGSLIIDKANSLINGLVQAIFIGKEKSIPNFLVSVASLLNNKKTKVLITNSSSDVSVPKTAFEQNSDGEIIAYSKYGTTGQKAHSLKIEAGANDSNWTLPYEENNPVIASKKYVNNLLTADQLASINANPSLNATNPVVSMQDLAIGNVIFIDNGEGFTISTFKEHLDEVIVDYLNQPIIPSVVTNLTYSNGVFRCNLPKNTFLNTLNNNLSVIDEFGFISKIENAEANTDSFYYFKDVNFVNEFSCPPNIQNYIFRKLTGYFYGFLAGSKGDNIIKSIISDDCKGMFNSAQGNNIIGQIVDLVSNKMFTFYNGNIKIGELNVVANIFENSNCRVEIDNLILCGSESFNNFRGAIYIRTLTDIKLNWFNLQSSFTSLHVSKEYYEPNVDGSPWSNNINIQDAISNNVSVYFDN